MSIKIIAAVSNNGIIGITENEKPIIPWNYPEDMKFFREQTKNSTIIMGKATFQSIGKPLPKRRNILISKTSKESNLFNDQDIEIFKNLDDALKTCNNDAWLIGGESIYSEGMNYADEIYLTLIPEYIDVNQKKHAKFPWINPLKFNVKEIISLSETLKVFVYQKTLNNH